MISERYCCKTRYNTVHQLSLSGTKAMSQATNNLAAYIWSLADLLRGDFKQSQYGRIILPFTLLRRLECVLAETKEAVLKQVEIVELMNLPEEGQEKLLLRATATAKNSNGLSFYNTSKMDLSTPFRLA